MPIVSVHLIAQTLRKFYNFEAAKYCDFFDFSTCVKEIDTFTFTKGHKYPFNRNVTSSIKPDFQDIGAFLNA